MGGLIPSMAVVDGEIIRLGVRKRKGDTRFDRVEAVRRVALVRGCVYFAVRADGVWSIYTAPMISAPVQAYGLSEDAAAMWLLHKEPRP